MITIDWTNPSAMVSRYFSVHEAIYLHYWNRLAIEEDGLDAIVRNNLVQSCLQWDVVREFIGSPMLTSDMYRPTAYNALPSIGGKPASWHIHGMAIDFVVLKMSCDDLRTKLLPMLPVWKVRMENRGMGISWIHLDKGPAFNDHWYFKP